MLYLKVSESHGSSLPAAARCTCTSRPASTQESTCQRHAQDQADVLQHVEGPAGASSPRPTSHRACATATPMERLPGEPFAVRLTGPCVALAVSERPEMQDRCAGTRCRASEEVLATLESGTGAGRAVHLASLQCD